MNSSRAFDLLPYGESLRLLLMLLQISLCAFGIAMAVASRAVLIGFGTICITLLVPLYLYRFSQVSGTQFNPFAGGDYYIIAIIAVLYLEIRNGGLERILNFIFRVSSIYAALYCLLWLAFALGYLHVPENSNLVLQNSGALDRGLRLSLANSYIIFGISVSMVSLIKLRNASSIFFLLLFFVALYFSGSRFLTLIILMSSVIYIALRNVRWVQIFWLSVFSLYLVAVLMIVFFHDFNPFSFIADNSTVYQDLSAWARWRSTEIAIDLLDSHWLLGIGIPSGPAAYQPLTYVNFFYPQDLGLLGIFTSYGVGGFLGYIFISISSQFLRLSTFSIPIHLRYGTLLTFTTILGYSILAPVFFMNALPFTCVILCTFLATRVRTHNQNMTVAAMQMAERNNSPHLS